MRRGVASASGVTKATQQSDAAHIYGNENGIRTPLVDALLDRSSRRHEKPFHVPGHKRGRFVSGKLCQVVALENDTTELEGLDNLQKPIGPIREASKLASHVWDADRTWFLVNGATVGIQAAIMALCYRGKEDGLVISRNAHQSAHNAVALCGCTPVYVTPYCEYGLAHHVEPKELERGFREALAKGVTPRAAIVVSPTYYGILSDIQKLSSICTSFNAYLIVDEAHGAHLRFIPPPWAKPDALQGGANVVIQSTHKQLGALTQSAMLHCRSISVESEQKITQILNMLQSSSPSYLLMGSLDAARAQVCRPDAAAGAQAAAEHIHDFFNRNGRINVFENTKDGTRLTLLRKLHTTEAYYSDFWRCTVMLHGMTGITGWSVANLLEQERGVVAEMSTRDCIVFAIGVGNSLEDAQALTSSLEWLICASGWKQAGLTCRDDAQSGRDDAKNGNKKICHEDIELIFKRSVMRMSPRDVLQSHTEMIPFDSTSLERIAAEAICPYPPGIPIILPGECICSDHIDYIYEEVLKQGGFVTGITKKSDASYYITVVSTG